MFTLQQVVKLPDTDAAGITFFGNYFRMAHEAYEAFMEEIGFGLRGILNDSEILILIAHADADYKAPLRLADEYAIELEVEKVGRTSYILSYAFRLDSGEVTATVRTVHVAINKSDHQAVRLPNKLRAELELHLSA